MVYRIRLYVSVNRGRILKVTRLVSTLLNLILIFVTGVIYGVAYAGVFGAYKALSIFIPSMFGLLGLEIVTLILEYMITRNREMKNERG